MNSISRRLFSVSYSCASNPRVWLTVSHNDNKVGDLVFELYANRNPDHAAHFQSLANGNEGRSYVGAEFNRGMAGLGVCAGKLEEENYGVEGVWNPDGDLTMRHHKRGILSATIDGTNRTGSEFMITFGEASMLNGSQTVLGELVEGDSVLAEIEKHVDRHGNVASGLKISASGSK